MKNFSEKIFICSADEDRYDVVQSMVYHLRNHGVDVWNDRYKMAESDGQFERNSIADGAVKCKYALIVISANAVKSSRAKEEIQVLKSRYERNEVVIFPVLYELQPCDIPSELKWIENLAIKQVDRASGTLRICNDIVRSITRDMLGGCRYKTIQETVNADLPLPKAANLLLNKYIQADQASLNSKIALLYSVYIVLEDLIMRSETAKAFEFLFSKTILNLTVDYNELRLLENLLCITINHLN